MPHEPGIAIRDNKVALAFLYWDRSIHLRRPCASGIDQPRRVEPRPIVQNRLAVRHPRNVAANNQRRTHCFRFARKMQCHRWRICHRILGDQQRAREPGPQIGLQFRKLARAQQACAGTPRSV